MNTGFREEVKGVYRLKVPFDKIYTSVFLVVHPEGNLLIDCATTAGNVDEYIIPALRELGVMPSDISAVVLTHRHSDHAGGLDRLLTYMPDVNVITDIRSIFPDLETYPMAGHTEDSIGVFDRRTSTLVSGDGLQGAGVDKYRCSIRDAVAYLETVGRIEADGRIENILFSHEYEPWYRNYAFGRESVIKCALDCKRYINADN